MIDRRLTPESTRTKLQGMAARPAEYVRYVGRRYADFLPVYWYEACGVSDFLRLVRVRLSKSKLGPVVCPHPIITTVALRSLGDDVVIRSHTTDVSVLGELIVGKGYKPALDAMNASPRLIVDLGANTGLVARWLLHEYPQAQLVAVEPEHGNAEILRSNLAPFSDQATVQECCAGAWRRTVEMVTTMGEFGFKMKDVSEENGGASQEAKVGSHVGISVRTMDDILALHHDQTIDLLKCDIEGAEAELFGDCSGWIRRVGCAVVECHEPYTGDLLLADIRRGGALFDVVARHPSPEFGNEVLIVKMKL